MKGVRRFKKIGVKHLCIFTLIPFLWYLFPSQKTNHRENSLRSIATLVQSEECVKDHWNSHKGNRDEVMHSGNSVPNNSLSLGAFFFCWFVFWFVCLWVLCFVVNVVWYFFVVGFLGVFCWVFFEEHVKVTDLAFLFI